MDECAEVVGERGGFVEWEVEEFAEEDGGGGGVACADGVGVGCGGIGGGLAVGLGGGGEESRAVWATG
jgi:hypothetical protein